MPVLSTRADALGPAAVSEDGPEVESPRENMSTEPPHTGHTCQRLARSGRWSVAGSQRWPWEHTWICRMLNSCEKGCSTSSLVDRESPTQGARWARRYFVGSGVSSRWHSGGEKEGKKKAGDGGSPARGRRRYQVRTDA